MLNALKAVVRSSPRLERTARRLLDRRYQLAIRYLRGVGLEVGALDRPLMMPRGVRCFYLDRMRPTELRRQYPELGLRPLYVSLVGNGETLDGIRDGGLDFVVANHFIEHAEDPVQTLITFARKLRPGGVVFMAVPDMRRTFDRDRAPTTWEHLLQDHLAGPQESRRAHFDEWVCDVEHLSGTAAERRRDELLGIDYSIHYHCWTREGFRDFLARVSAQEWAPLACVAVRSWRNENIFVLRKVAHGSE